MPKCSACDRRVWVWQADLLGRSCATCRAANAEAREADAAARRAEQQKAFAARGALGRALVGARRGAIWGVVGLLAVGLTLFARVGGDPGSRFPSNTLGLGWAIASLLAVATGVGAGYFLYGIPGAVIGLVVVGAVAGAVVGAVRGARGEWAFPQ